MKIALISSINQLTPSKNYGSAQRIVFSLSKRLVQYGHDVTIFGINNPLTESFGIKYDSLFPNITKSKLIKRMPQFIHFNYSVLKSLLSKFDVIHNHIVTPGFFEGTLVHKIRKIFLTSLHNNPPLSTRGNYVYKWALEDSPAVALSYNQCNLLKDRVNIIDVIHNGIDPNEFIFNDIKSDFLFCLGAVAPWKGTHVAVQIANELDETLLIAGPIQYDSYFVKQIRPFLNEKVRYLGLISESKKKKLLSLCKGVIFPVLGEEPFGVVLLEAMSSGAPMIAFKYGAIPEIVDNKKTGYVCSSYDEMLDAVIKIHKINPTKCRERVQSLFSDSIMSQKYVQLYYQLN